MNHQLIDRLQNFTLDRKILSIDSNDRDINKWPNPYEFEVSCPQNYTNVESIRLISIQTPNVFYNISEQLQNNKLIVNYNAAGNTTIILEDGLYTSEQLQNALQNEFAVVDSGFKVIYNEVNKKMYFGHSANNFLLIFDKSITYNNDCLKQSYNNIYNQHSKWGLGAMLGFDKKTYNSTNGLNKFQYASTAWITSNTNIIASPKILDLDENQYIFVEIDKLNSCDEIKPYLVNNHSNANSGIVNSFFAKVPIIKSYQNQSLNSKDCYLEGVSYYQPPIEKLSKIKIKCRHHNGMYFDLQNYNISLTLEINQIRSEMKDYNVRTPFTI